MIGKHIKNRGVKQKSALRHPVFSYSMGDTLISPIVASYLLYLAVTYTLIRTYLDKPDNLHTSMVTIARNLIVRIII